MTEKIDIRELSFDEIVQLVEQIGEKTFRAKQIFEWLWKKNASSFDEMSNLPNTLRENLKNQTQILHLILYQQQKSADKTIKCTFQTQKEKKLVEGVLIPTSTRMTACISSQVGCSLACKFCATGKLGFERNLSAGEIVDQLVSLKNIAENEYHIPISNIVYMGMGEPLLNYKNVIKSIEYLTSKEGLEISPRRITLSTAGIAKMIKKLADDEIKVNLALSLHAANDQKRSQIMEINESNHLETLKEALQYYHQKTGNRVTFEYILLNQFNDQKIDAQELAEFCKCVPCKINLIEYNSIGDGIYVKSNQQNTDDFISFLESKNLIVNFRRSRGKDIDAACGQLANKLKK